MPLTPPDHYPVSNMRRIQGMYWVVDAVAGTALRFKTKLFFVLPNVFLMDYSKTLDSCFFL